MDLYAYGQIPNLEQIMVDNNISIPRLRGLRLMKDEKPITKEEMDDLAKSYGLYDCDNLCRCGFRPNAGWITMSTYTDMIAEKYLEYEEHNGRKMHTQPIYIKWDKVHGKKRKAFKYVLKQSKKRVYNQYKMWNKYCGRDDVLYIHCRLGAGNWFGYDCDTIIKSQPWFLDCVEDSFDGTYLDVYAKINLGGVT